MTRCLKKEITQGLTIRLLWAEDVLEADRQCRGDQEAAQSFIGENEQHQLVLQDREAPVLDGEPDRKFLSMLIKKCLTISTTILR